jgi:DNA-binding XRE family transcriptional regulator
MAQQTGAVSRLDDPAFAAAYARRPRSASSAHVTPDDYYWRMIIGQNIRVLRKAHRWSQQRLAEEAGCDRQSINRVERAAYSPSCDRLARMAAALGVAPAALWREVELPLARF